MYFYCNTLVVFAYRTLTPENFLKIVLVPLEFGGYFYLI